MTAAVSVFTENASVHRESRRFPPQGDFFILSKVAAFGRQGFMRCSAEAGATQTNTHTHTKMHEHTHFLTNSVQLALVA